MGPGGLPQSGATGYFALALKLVGIVCALAAEARHLGPQARRDGQVASLSDGTLIAVTGMGAAAAAAGADALARAGATAVASWGMAGGLDPELAPGTVFIPDAVVAPDGTRVSVTSEWREQVVAAIMGTDKVARGVLLTSQTAIATPADKERLFSSTGARAVDMESLAVAQVADTLQLPFIALRVIVDGAQDVLPRAVTAAADRAGHLHMWRLLGELALAPGDLPPLIRLAWCYRSANRSLASVARARWHAPSVSTTESRLS